MKWDRQMIEQDYADSGKPMPEHLRESLDAIEARYATLIRKFSDQNPV